MKILFYAHSSTLYGANRSLIELIIGLRELNPEWKELVVLPQEGIIEEELKKQAINYVVLRHYNWFFYKPFADNWKSKSFWQYRLWYLKNKWKKKALNKFFFPKHLKAAQQFSPDLVYINSSLNPMGLMVAKKLSIKNLWHHRETINDEVYGYFLENKKKFIEFYHHTNLHLFPSNFLKNNYLHKFGEVPARVIFNSVLLEKEFLPKDKLPAKIRFGIVGRINEQKAQKEIIQLFASKELKKQKIELHVIGHVEERFKDCKNYASDNIVFHDFIKREEIFEKFDFLISNARFEAFGRTIAEANYCGIPVIARCSGAFPEIVDKNTGGYIFKNKEGFSQIIKNLTRLTDAEYKILSERAIDHTKRNFEYLKVAMKVENELNNLINLSE